MGIRGRVFGWGLLALALALTFAIGLVATPASQADSGPGKSGSERELDDVEPVDDGYIGPAWINALGCDETWCLQILAVRADAWRWTGTSWQPAQLTHGYLVHTVPYGGGWRCVWTRATGWVAVPERMVWHGWNERR